MSIAPRVGARPSGWLRWLPLLAWVGFIVCLFRPGAAGFAWAGQQPWGDKIAHVLLIGTLAFLLDHALARRRVRLWRCRVPLAALLLASFMTAEEVSQLWVPGRSFEWGDLAANYLGIGAAGLASAWLSRRRARAGDGGRAGGAAVSRGQTACQGGSTGSSCSDRVIRAPGRSPSHAAARPPFGCHGHRSRRFP